MRYSVLRLCSALLCNLDVSRVLLNCLKVKLCSSKISECLSDFQDGPLSKTFRYVVFIIEIAIFPALHRAETHLHQAQDIFV